MAGNEIPTKLIGVAVVPAPLPLDARPGPPVRASVRLRFQILSRDASGSSIVTVTLPPTTVDQAMLEGAGYKLGGLYSITVAADIEPTPVGKYYGDLRDEVTE